MFLSKQVSTLKHTPLAHLTLLRSAPDHFQACVIAIVKCRFRVTIVHNLVPFKHNRHMRRQTPR
jgi:biotin synthase-related radical SAM superfamily protein